MPAVGAVKVLHDFQFTYEKETTWGTAVDTAATGIPTDDLVLSVEPNAHRIPRAMGYRALQEDVSWQDTTAKIPTVSFKTPIIQPMLQGAAATGICCGVMQNSSAWAAGSNKYTIYTVNYANMPNPKRDNEGYFYTFTRRSPASSDSVTVKDTILHTMKLSLHPTDNNGLLYGDFEGIGSLYSRGVNSSATVTQSALTYVYSWDSLDTFTINATDNLADLHSFEITVSNGAKFVGDNPKSEIAFPKWDVKAKFTLAGNANTETYAGYVNSSAISTAIPIALKWGDGTISAAGELNMYLFGLFTGFSHDYNEGELVTLDFEGIWGGAAEYPFYYEVYGT